MADENLNCSVCQERYSNDRRPRCLSCGHVVCTKCLGQVLVHNRKCPECRDDLNLARAEDYAVVYPLLNLARGTQQYQIPRMGRGGMLDSVKSAAVYDAAGKLQSVDKFCDILKETLKIRNSYVLEYERKRVNIERELYNIERELAKTINEIEAEKDKERRLIEKLRLATQVKEGLEEALQGLAEICTNEGVLGAVQKIEDIIADFDDVQVINLLDMEPNGKQTLVALLDDGVDLYMTQTLAQQMRFGCITKHEDKLLLSALRDGSPPSNGISLPFEGVRRLVPGESPWVYLEVGWQGQHRGNVYIQLYGDTPRAQQMALLCSGETGSSYRGTSFYKHEKTATMVEWIIGGDYEHNDGTGGQAIVEGIIDGGEYSKPMKAGLLGGYLSTSPQCLGNFLIILTDNPKRNNSTAHGEVKSGLNILLEAAQLSQIKDAMVTNCGLVIPLDESDSNSLYEFESRSGPSTNPNLTRIIN